MQCFELGWVSLTTSIVLAFTPPAQAQSRPNVLVVVLDDVGAEKLGIYAPPVATPPTPVLTQLAQSGVRFTNAYANPVCSPTRASLMTGRYAFRTGMGDVSGSYVLPLAEVSLAELLKQGFPLQASRSRYRCGAFGKWHLTAPMNRTHPIDQGFDDFAGPLSGVSDHFDWSLVRADAAGTSSTPIGSPVGPFDETTFTASVVRREALTWINAQPEPFFAYVCFSPPHNPFQVPPLSTVSPATQATINARGYAPGDDLGGTPDDDLAYDWMIEAVDTELGRLVGGITQARLANTTILVVTDNGTPAPVIEEPPYDNAHAKGTVYEQGTRVGLVAAGRGVNPEGHACKGLVHTVDIFHTVAALTGAALPNDVTLDGVSFRDMLRAPSTASARTQVLTQHFMPNGAYVPNPLAPPPGLTSHDRAMNDGRFKYVRIGVSAPTERAFDLAADPLELVDLWPSLAAQPASTQARIQALKSTMIGLSGF